MRPLTIFSVIALTFSTCLVGILSYAANADKAEYAWSEVGEQKILVEWERPYIYIDGLAFSVKRVEVGFLKSTWYDEYGRMICYTTPMGGVWINVDVYEFIMQNKKET